MSNCSVNACAAKYIIVLFHREEEMNLIMDSDSVESDSLYGLV